MKRIYIALILSTILLSSNAFCYQIEEAKAALQDSTKYIEEMKINNFSTQRVEDLFFDANQTYQIQIKKTKKDFSRLIEKTSEIKNLWKKSFAVNDEIRALEGTIMELPEEIDKEKINQYYNLAIKEFQDERYDKSVEYIELTYSEISQASAGLTKLTALYDASAKNLYYFLINNWQIIIISIAILGVILFIMRIQIKILNLKRKKKKLILEKKIIEKLIKKSQHEYFKKGKIAESTYNIRTKKFGEMLREIERQLPLIEEEFAKIKFYIGKK